MYVFKFEGMGEYVLGPEKISFLSSFSDNSAVQLSLIGSTYKKIFKISLECARIVLCHILDFTA